MKIIKMNLYLKRKIEESNFSIKEIAKFCDLSPQTFSNYFNGSQSPTLKVLEQIAAKISCNVHELITPPENYDHIYTSQGFWMGMERVFK